MMIARVIGRDVDCAGKVLGVAGDHKTETVVFEFDFDLTGVDAAVKLNNGSDYATQAALSAEGNRVSWLVAEDYLLHGNLTCQLLLIYTEYADPHVWQSAAFTLEVLESVEGA